MKRNRYILIGILAGILTGGGWLAWAAIQSQTGGNVLDPITSTWNPIREAPYRFPFVSNLTKGVAGSGTLLFETEVNNAWGAWFAASSLGSNQGNLSNLGATVNHLFVNSSNGYAPNRSVSAATLTQTQAQGITPTVTYSSWSITNTPASATQATSSKAANASLRHVATSITVCLASTAVGGNAPLNFNLRDGATGAGTILWTSIQTTAGIANGGTCTTLSGLAMIGTINTAMTLESAASPAANGTATVTLTGFSVS